MRTTFVLANTFLWIIIVFLFSIDVAFLVQFLRARPRTTKGLLGLLSNCLITLAALTGLIYIQTHNIDSFTSHSYFLFLAALFVEQLIAQWTLYDQAQVSSSHMRFVRITRAIMTGFVAIYVVIVLVIFIFQL